MADYRPDKFAAEFATPTGKKLWEVLNRPEVVARMETASDLGQPALKPVEDILLAELGEAMLADRVKQMTGHMVRQIMEDRGFVHDASDIKLNSVPFYKASRYRRPEKANLYLFRSSKDVREVVLSDDRSGASLPSASDGAKWNFFTSLSSPLKARIGYGIDLDAARVAVSEKGYSRHRVERMLRPA